MSAMPMSSSSSSSSSAREYPDRPSTSGSSSSVGFVTIKRRDADADADANSYIREPGSVYAKGPDIMIQDNRKSCNAVFSIVNDDRPSDDDTSTRIRAREDALAMEYVDIDDSPVNDREAKAKLIEISQTIKVSPASLHKEQQIPDKAKRRQRYPRTFSRHNNYIQEQAKCPNKFKFIKLNRPSPTTSRAITPPEHPTTTATVHTQTQTIVDMDQSFPHEDTQSSPERASANKDAATVVYPRSNDRDGEPDLLGSSSQTVRDTIQDIQTREKLLDLEHLESVIREKKAACDKKQRTEEHLRDLKTSIVNIITDAMEDTSPESRMKRFELLMQPHGCQMMSKLFGEEQPPAKTETLFYH